MKKAIIFMVIITALVLTLTIFYPISLGNRTPVWELKERCFGDEYVELRSEHFISMRYSISWNTNDSIFYIATQDDVFSPEKAFLQVKKETAKECKILSSGMIEWCIYDYHIRIDVSAFEDNPMNIVKGFDEFTLDKTIESMKKFEEITGANACEIIDTVSLIRSEYRDSLYMLSLQEYNRVCNSRNRTIIILSVIWGVYIMICSILFITDKLCDKRLNKDMKEFCAKEKNK